MLKLHVRICMYMCPCDGLLFHSHAGCENKYPPGFCYTCQSESVISTNNENIWLVEGSLVNSLCVVHHLTLMQTLCSLVTVLELSSFHCDSYKREDVSWSFDQLFSPQFSSIYSHLIKQKRPQKCCSVSNLSGGQMDVTSCGCWSHASPFNFSGIDFVLLSDTCYICGNNIIQDRPDKWTSVWSELSLKTSLLRFVIPLYLPALPFHSLPPSLAVG